MLNNITKNRISYYFLQKPTLASFKQNIENDEILVALENIS